MRQRNSFSEVLHNCDDQVLVRHLITHLLTEEQKQWVVDEFNKEALAYEARRADAETAARCVHANTKAVLISNPQSNLIALCTDCGMYKNKDDAWGLY